MITTFIEYLKEVKLANLTTVIGKGDLYKDLVNYQHDDYIEDVPFVSNVFLEDYGIDINVVYHHSVNHDLLKRLKNRTEINSNSDFNEVIEKVVNAIPNEIGRKIKKTGKYDMYLIDSKLHVIVLLNYNNLFSNNPKVLIVTLLKGGAINDVLDTIIIPE